MDKTSSLNSGSSAAGEVAARISGKRKQRILQLLQERGPLTLWELSEVMLVQVNQISGRLSELNADAMIGQIGTRNHPVSHVPCAIWRISEQGKQTIHSPRIGTDSHRLNSGHGSEICVNRPQSVDKTSSLPESR